MKNKISFLKFEIINTTFIIIFGFLSHYLYDLLNQNLFIGIICPINESVWEHLKLLFFPTLISIIIGYFYYKGIYFNYLKNKTIALIYSLIFIIVSFYTYTGIIGHHFLIIDILIFIISCIFIFFYSLNKINYNYYSNNKVYIFILVLLVLLFLIFTFYPLDINLFK